MSHEGIEKILSHIKAAAEREISGIRNKAQAEADKISSAAQEKADREAEKILSDGERSASLERQRTIAETKISVRRKMMGAQEEAISASLEASRKVLEELAEKGKWDTFVYKDILFSLIASASEIVAGNELGLVFNERDKKAFHGPMLAELGQFVTSRTGRNPSLSVIDETMPCLGGVLVRDLEKSVEVDHTLETKLDRLKEVVRVDVARILFGDRL